MDLRTFSSPVFQKLFLENDSRDKAQSFNMSFPLLLRTEILNEFNVFEYKRIGVNFEKMRTVLRKKYKNLSMKKIIIGGGAVVNPEIPHIPDFEI